MKTSGQIEQDIFNILKNSALKGIVKGSIYKKGTRPFNATTEDLVINFLTGKDYQIQTGIVNLNVYVQDINNGNSGMLIKNVVRCNQIEQALMEFTESIRLSNEYFFERDETIHTLESENNERLVNCRLKYRRTTF